MEIRRWLVPLGALLLLAIAIGLVRTSAPRRGRGLAVPRRSPPPSLESAERDAAQELRRRERLRERLRRELGDAYDDPLPSATDADRARGAELWSLLCAGCHAEDARGRRTLSRMLPVPPGDLTDPERAVFYSDRAKLRILSDGSEGTPMFGWKDILDVPDRLAVLAHLRTLVEHD